MVCGEIGTGKTMLTKIASSEVGHGVIYVDIPSNVEEVGEAFEKALNYSFESYTVRLMKKILVLRKLITAIVYKNQNLWPNFSFYSK